jgi:hypothetical protein
MCHERPETAADGEHARAGEAVEGAAAREGAHVGLRDLAAELGELALRDALLGIEVGDATIERRERERGRRRGGGGRRR